MTEDHLKLARHVASWYKIPYMDEDDLAQEAALAMHKLLLRRPEAHNGQLINAARSHLGDLAEKGQIQTQPIGRGHADNAPSPVDWASSHERRNWLYKVLSEKAARIIEATYWEHAEAADIATELGISAAQVYKVRSRAMKKIRDLVGGNDDFTPI